MGELCGTLAPLVFDRPRGGREPGREIRNVVRHVALVQRSASITSRASITATLLGSFALVFGRCETNTA